MVLKSKFTICYTVNFVFTPTKKKFFDLQYDNFKLLGKCKYKIIQYDILQIFVFTTLQQICKKKNAIFRRNNTRVTMFIDRN